MKNVFLLLLLIMAGSLPAQHINYAETPAVAKQKRIKSSTIYAYKGDDTLNATVTTTMYYDSLSGKPYKMVAINPSLQIKNTFDFTYYNCPEGLMIKQYRLIEQRGVKIDTSIKKIPSRSSHSYDGDSCTNKIYAFSYFEAAISTPAERVFDRLISTVYYYPKGLRRGYIFTEKPVVGNAEDKVNSRLRFEYDFFKE